MKPKGRQGERNHCLGMRNRGEKAIENDTQKEIPIPITGKI